MKRKRISIITLLGSIAVALLMVACPDDSGDNTSFVYMCANGTPVDSPDDKPDTAGDTKCASCDPGYLLVDEACQAFTITIELGNTTQSGATFTATASHNATLYWVVYDDGTIPADATALINDAQTGSGKGATRSGDDGVALAAKDAQVITIDSLQAATPYTLYVAITLESEDISVLSSVLSFDTLALGIPAFTDGPAIVQDSVDQTSAEITLSANESTKLYWVVYDSAQTTLTAAMLKADAESGVGENRVAVSGSNETVTADIATTISLGQGTADNPTLNALTDYHFYAVLVDNDNNQTLSSGLLVTTTGYAYVCQHGKELDDTTDTENSMYCISCNDYYKLDTDTNNCIPIQYFCSNGDKASGNPNATDDPDVPNKNVDIEKCTSCTNPSHIIHNGLCEAFSFSVAPTASGTTASGTTITTTASHDATLHWVIYEGHDVSKTDATTVYNEAQDMSTAIVAAKSGSTGIALTGEISQSPFIGGSLAAETEYTAYVVITATADTTKRVLSSDITFTTTPTGIPGFSPQPAATAITQTTASITLTADESTPLYWVLATTEQTLTANQLKTATVGGDIVAVNPTNESVTANTVKSIPLTDLSPKQPHFFYALLEDTDDNQTLSNELTFSTPGYEYQCTNGMKEDGTTTTEGMTNCASCNNYYKKTVDNSCVATQYFCSNGDEASGSPNAMDDSDVTDKNADVEKCMSCTADKHIVHNGLCVPFAFDGQPTTSNVTANTATLTATATHDATLHWVVYEMGTTKDSAATVISEADNDSSVSVIARSGSTGVSLTAGTADSTTTISGLSQSTTYALYVTITSTALNDLDTADSNVVILSELITLETNNTGAPNFTTQPAATQQQTTATVTLTADESTDLYWVVYKTPQTLSADEIKGAAHSATEGVERSGPTTDSVTKDTEKSISLGGTTALIPLTPYYFYAMLEDSDGNQTTATALSFTTTGYPYVCAGGDPADGQAASENTTMCANCNPGFTKEGDSCNADIIGIWEIDDDVNFGATAACLVTFVADGSVEWNGACTDYSPIDSYDTYEVDGISLIFNKSSGQGHGIQHDFTIDRDDSTGVLTINPHSSTLGGNHYLRSYTPEELLGIWEIDDDVNFGATAACVVAFLADSRVVWNGACADYSPINSYDSYEVDVNSLIFNKSSGQGHGIQHDFTIDRDDTTGVLTINPHSSTLSGNHYLRLHSGLVFTETTAISQTAATVAVTPSHSGTLYWVLYTDGTAAPTANAVVSSAGTSAGEARSAAGGTSVTALNSATINISNINALADYDLYAVLVATIDGTAMQLLSESYDLSTTGYAYVCANGDPIDGTSATAGVTNCSGCTGSFWLDGATASCIAHGTLDADSNYGVASNGVTITCGGTLTAGDSFEINGVEYTKRDNSATHPITTTNAAASCTTGITDMGQLFQDQTFNGDISHWDTASVTDMNQMFRNTMGFTQNINNWDVSSVTDMSNMFRASDFNQDIGGWQTHSVADMAEMFRYNESFNQKIGSWDVQNVTDMQHLFGSADAFNQDISNWCVTDIDMKPTGFDSGALLAGTASNQPQWGIQHSSCRNRFACTYGEAAKTTPATEPATDNTIQMCTGCDTGFNLETNQCKPTVPYVCSNGEAADGLAPSANSNLCKGCDTGYYLTDDMQCITALAFTCTNGTPADGQAPAAGTILCTGCDTGYSLITGECFQDGVFSRHNNGVTIVCPGVANLGTGVIDGVTYTKRNRQQLLLIDDGNHSEAETACTTDVTDMERLFTGSETFNSDISHWDVSSVTNMSELFRQTQVFNRDISSWDVGSVTNTRRMFGNAKAFNQPIGNWNFASLTDMRQMFNDAAVFNQDIGSWDVSRITNMSSLFNSTNNFNNGGSPSINNWDVSNVTNMSFMFLDAVSFKQPIGNWNVSNVTTMIGMFEGGGFNQDISGWDVSNVRYPQGFLEIFREATEFNSIDSNANAVQSDLSGWCVQIHYDDVPFSGPIVSEIILAYDHGTNEGFTDALKPDWDGSSTNNRCPINFVQDPAAGGVDGSPTVDTTTLTATTAQVKITASRNGTVHWIAYPTSSSATVSNVAALKTATAGNAGADRSAAAGRQVVDDVEYTIDIDGLTTGTEYRVFVGLELNDDGNLETDLESVTFTTN